jgi:sugar lactone lactonase YvrE
MRPLSAAILSLAISSCAIGQTYTVKTLAGSPIPGYTGDNGYATAAQLDYPWGLTADASGNLFIADHANNVIREISKAVITTVAGNGVAFYSGDSGQATNASLSFPSGVAVDASGNLFIADYFNQRIRKVSKGVITTYAGTGNSSGFSGDGGQAISAQLGGPEGVAVDAAGNLYIADVYNQRIRKVATNGVITTVAGNGTAGYSGDGGLAVAAQLRSPYGLTLDAAGNLYIADSDNNCIRKVSTNGIIATVAGNATPGYSGDGGPAVSAQLKTPWSVAVDSAGAIYIADLSNNAVRKVSNGTITTVAGGGSGFTGAGPANGIGLNAPNGVAVDVDGNLYIADTGNQRILELVPPAPAILGLSAFPITPTGLAGTLTVGGAGFQVGAVVQWNGSALSTVFVSGTQLTATVPASLLSAVGLVAITVVNPGGATSSASSFPLNVPALTFNTSSLPAGAVGTAYLQTLSVGGGLPPYSNWIVTSALRSTPTPGPSAACPLPPPAAHSPSPFSSRIVWATFHNPGTCRSL